MTVATMIVMVVAMMVAMMVEFSFQDAMKDKKNEILFYTLQYQSFIMFNFV